jgi:hypothetical protein
MKLIKIRNKEHFRKEYNPETNTWQIAAGKYTFQNKHHTWEIRYDLMHNTDVYCLLDKEAFTQHGLLKCGYIVEMFRIETAELHELYPPLYATGKMCRHGGYRNGKFTYTYNVELGTELGARFYLEIEELQNKEEHRCLTLSLRDSFQEPLDANYWRETTEVPEYLNECLDCVQAVQDFILEYMV